MSIDITAGLPRAVLLTAVLMAGNVFAQQVSVPKATSYMAKVARSNKVVTKKPAPKSTLPAGMTFITDMEGVREYRLNNGLKILLFPDASKQTFTLNVTYLVGSRHEGYGETGMAHVLERMLFKGTPSRGKLVAALKKRKAKYNGTTNVDRTNYFETLPSKEDNLPWAIALEADRMVNSKISAADLKTEKAVVLGEFDKYEKRPLNLLYKRVNSVAFDWHNYGNSTIGNRNDVANVSAQPLKVFYKKYYQPDNAVVTLSGRFDTKEALELLAKYFGKIPKPKRQLPSLWTKEYTQDGERSVVLRRNNNQQVLMAAYHIPGVLHPDTPALTMLDQLLVEQPAGKLYKALVSSKLASGVGSVSGNRVDPGLLLYLVTLNPKGDRAAAKSVLLNTLEDTGKTQFTQADVQRIRERLISQYKQQWNKTDSVGLLLSESAAAGDWRLYFQFRDQLLKVTAEDVNRVAAQYLKPSNRTVGELIPTPKPDLVEITPAPTATEVLKDYLGQEAQQAGKTLNSSLQTLEQQVKRETVAGVKVAFLPQKTRSKRVYLQLNLNFGNAQTARTEADAAFFVGAMLTRGSQGLTRKQLKDRLEEYKSTLSVSSGATGASIRVNTERKYLPQVLKLLQKVLREPIFPQAEFALLRKASIDSLVASQKDPNRVASLNLARAFMPANAKRGDLTYIRTASENIEDLKALKLEKTKAYYNKIWSAGNAQLAVVGDFDPKTVRQAIPTLVKGFKSQVKYQRVSFPLVTPKAQDMTLNVSGQTKATYAARTAFALRDDAPDAPALMVAMQIFGQGNQSRLSKRIRSKEKISQRVSASVYLSSLEKKGLYTALAIYDPKFHKKMMTAMGSELDLVLQKGFTAEEVKAAQNALLATAQISRSQEATLADQLVKQLLLNRTYKFNEQLEAKIKKVTPQTALAAFKKYVNPKQLVVVRVGNFPDKGSTSSQ